MAFWSAIVLCLGGAIIVGINFSFATNAVLVAFLTAWISKKLSEYD